MISKKSWHKKVKWTLKRLVFKPPTNDNQMRELCNSIIQKKYSSHPTSAVVNTALELWKDPNLVNALYNNQTFFICKRKNTNFIWTYFRRKCI
jgi:hypothetical protein